MNALTMRVAVSLAVQSGAKACAAVAFVDGATEWKAASCLRTICAALDSPLPPQLGDDILP